jgi:hypothetical protein
METLQIFTTHFGDWVLVLAGLGFAVYAMLAIKKESKEFKEETYQVQLGPVLIPIPEWWTLVQQTDHELVFERTDTRYDWQGRFRFVPENSPRPLTEILSEKVHQEEIDYDAHEVQVTTEPTYLFRQPSAQKNIHEAVRVEGTASQKIIERVYIDFYLFRSRHLSGYFICESKSSVLNGMLEGPFFEECLSDIEWKDHNISNSLI